MQRNNHSLHKFKQSYLFTFILSKNKNFVIIFSDWKSVTLLLKFKLPLGHPFTWKVSPLGGGDKVKEEEINFQEGVAKVTGTFPNSSLGPLPEEAWRRLKPKFTIYSQKSQSRQREEWEKSESLTKKIAFSHIKGKFLQFNNPFFFFLGKRFSWRSQYPAYVWGDGAKMRLQSDFFATEISLPFFWAVKNEQICEGKWIRRVQILLNHFSFMKVDLNAK